jgi:hypothetical protein
MNIQKLTAHNMKNPLGKRIDSTELARKVSTAHARGNMVALLATIHSEIDGKLQEQRAAYEAHYNPIPA